MGERAGEMSINDGTINEGDNFADTSPTLATAMTPEGQGDETEQLRADIEETRAGMDETIDAIQQKLSPEQIMGQVKKSVREATIGRVEKVMENVGEKISQVTEPAVEAASRAGTAIKESGSSAVDTIRQNPLPFALIGVGVGMLLANKYWKGSGGYRAGREAPQPQSRTEIEKAQNAVGDAVSTVQATASNVAGQAREQISWLGDQSRQGALQASYQLRETFRETPLAVGAVAMAVGAAVGLAVPATRVEQEYLGEARDKLVDKAEQVAQDTMQKVQSVAQEAGRAVQQEVQSQGKKA